MILYSFGPVIQRLVCSFLGLDVVAQNLRKVIPLGSLCLQLVFWSEIVHRDNLRVPLISIFYFHWGISQSEWVHLLANFHMIELVKP